MTGILHRGFLTSDSLKTPGKKFTSRRDTSTWILTVYEDGRKLNGYREIEKPKLIIYMF